jgi:hypothetical protein
MFHVVGVGIELAFGANNVVCGGFAEIKAQ